MRGKIHARNRGGQTNKIKIEPKFRQRKAQKIKIRLVLVALVLVGVALIPPTRTQAESCPALRIVFARGSGGERWNDRNYLAFKAGIESKLATVNLDYEFIDLDYPAVGIDKLDVLIGAAVGSGDAYEFGESIDTGVQNLAMMIKGADCPNTKYVIGGYSQGAMVISKSLRNLTAAADRIIYAATFGDPKIYLPEGGGLMPAACRGENLSDYRMHVPDCRAYKGLLGAYMPYEPDSFTGKVGTWCNRRDIFCSSYLNMSDHLAYVGENLYEDASKVIFDKITREFGLENHVSSPHDTAILIDSTESMDFMINQYKTEALRLAKETFESGGRVALFDYRDLDDPYDLVKHCGFNDCTLETFQNELDEIKIDTGGGGDVPESLLSGAYHAMEMLDWKQGATKSLVVLTDAHFISPDRDGITLDKVVALSKRIDPVNFYIITDATVGWRYTDLAEATDGRVVTDFDELSLLTDYIMGRYDSLPRVEEMEAPMEVPQLEVVDVTQTTGTEIEATIKFTNTGTRAIVVLNDAVLGVTEDSEITISGLDASRHNVVTLIPVAEDVKGEPVTVRLTAGGFGEYGKASLYDNSGTESKVVIAPELPAAPATGRR